MKKITLHIDSRPEFLGQVLEVTDESGDTIPYAIEYADAADMKKFATASKIVFHADSEDRARKHAVRYFSATLGSAARIDVYGDRIRRRFPSTCAYTFCGSSTPAEGADPPFNFEYAVARFVTPVEVGGDAPRVAEAMARVRRDAFGAHAHDFPGISARDSFLRLFERSACPEIHEDALAVPWDAGYRERWFPTLRDDGRVGIFATTSARQKKHYLVAESALPHFACDQLICAVRANVEGWTWRRWAESEEVRAARRLAVETVEEVAARALRTLDAWADVSEVAHRVSSERFVTVSNVLRAFDKEDVTYDAEIARVSDWHLGRTLLVRVESREDAGTPGYALVRNKNRGGQAFDVVLPTTFEVARFEDAEDAVAAHFGSLRAIIDVEVLREIEP